MSILLKICDFLKDEAYWDIQFNEYRISIDSCTSSRLHDIINHRYVICLTSYDGKRCFCRFKKSKDCIYIFEDIGDRPVEYYKLVKDKPSIFKHNHRYHVETYIGERKK